MSVWRPLFIKCIILDHKLQRMLNDSKIGQLNSERPLHQTAVGLESMQSCIVRLSQVITTASEVLKSHHENMKRMTPLPRLT